jgi:hypothetical protein
MTKSTWRAVAILLALGAAGIAPADDAVAWKPARPCLPGDPALAKARRDWRRVDAEIRGLRDDSDVAPANQALIALLASRCFAPSEESTRDLPAGSALALRTFWASGGRDWALSCLDRQAAPNRVREIIVPPDVRPWLSAEKPSKGVPSELLCPVTDAACRETARGWAEEADRYFRALALIPGRIPAPVPPSGQELSDVCWEQARHKSVGERYVEWRSCLEWKRPFVPALPLAAYRAPSVGWLILRGARQGDREFCWELRAYHLDTGAAQIARTCIDDVRTAKGVRDAEASEATRRSIVTAGTLNLEALRKTAWMAVLSERVGPTQVEAVRCPLPHGLVPSWPRGGRCGSVPGWVLGFATHTTTLHWRWLSDRPLTAGTITWPPVGHDPAGEYTVGLLKATEASLVAGCPSARAPAEILDVGTNDDEIEARFDAQLRAALLQPPASCASPAPTP